MEIQVGTNANCSEIVCQLCGITKDIAEKIKEDFKRELKDKYKEDYLEKHADELFSFKGKYHLGFFDYDGSEDIPDYKIIIAIAKIYGATYDYVGCCSDSIDDDKSMDDHIKWRKEKDEYEEPSTT